MAFVSVAIDGPAATGKTTVGSTLARRQGWLFVDTGAMYRAVTLAALRSDIQLDDEAAVGEIARNRSIEIDPGGNGDLPDRLLLNGEDVTELLHTTEVDRAVSIVSALAPVREAMVKRQRTIAARQSVVMAGRDIATNVLPAASFKIYLDARPDVRAERRCGEIRKRGEPAVHEQILKQVLDRDRLDSERSLNPLRAAADATVVDTSDLTLDEVIDAVARLVNPSHTVTQRTRRADWVARAILGLSTRYQIEGASNVPRKGPLLLIANHLNLADPVLIVASAGRPITFMVKKELLDNLFFRWMVRATGVRAMPVRRAQPDRSALTEAVSLLARGQAVLMFPEGTRSLDSRMALPHAGVALIARMSDAPIVPVGIVGTDQIRGTGWLFRRPRIGIRYGRPFHLGDLPERAGAKERDAKSFAMMQRVAALLPERNRGVYALNAHDPPGSVPA